MERRISANIEDILNRLSEEQKQLLVDFKAEKDRYISANGQHPIKLSQEERTALGDEYPIISQCEMYTIDVVFCHRDYPDDCTQGPVNFLSPSDEIAKALAPQYAELSLGSPTNKLLCSAILKSPDGEEMKYD